VTHEEVRNSIDAWALGALPEAEARAVETHLETCAECQAEARALAGVAAGLAASVPDDGPSPAVRARLMARVSGTPAPAAPARAEVAVPIPVQPPSSSWAVRAGWLAAAAALVLSAFLTWDGLRLRDRVATLSAELAEARALVAASESRIADLQRAADRGTTAMAVLTAPDVARISLAGQPDAPDARAVAYWSRARGMVFNASKLPPPPAGKTYQVWVVTTDPAPLSAGLIEPDANGQVDVVFATPPDIPQPVAVAVTLEPAGGVPSPTGAKYLVGTV
jgi:anti-sigma-K factor RskA